MTDKKKAWQVSGKLRTGNATEAVRLQCEFKDRPEYYTVQFNVDRNNPITAPGLFIQPQAEVLWAVEGNFVRRLISINEGIAISGAGQSVTVKMFDYSATTLPAVEYNVSAQVVKGTRSAQERPPILNIGPNPNNRGGAQSQLVPPAGNATYTLPTDTGINGVYVTVGEADNTGTPIATDEILVDFISSAASLKAMNYSGCNQWVAVPPGTQLIVITNNRGAGNINITVEYGIEG